MGTKNDPGKYDCYAKAEPDEPIFVLCARDPLAPALVMRWARHAEEAGEAEKAAEAKKLAADMRRWRDERNKRS